jgi:hypothetical protein
MYGFEDFDEAQWSRVEESWKAAMKVRSYTMVMYAGGKDDPLYSNLFGLLKVDDSQAYLASLRKSMEIWNELTAQSTSDIKMDYEMTDVEVAGAKGLFIAADVAKAAGDEDVPGVKVMFEAMFGKDGKMERYCLVSDQNTVIFAMSDEAGAGRAVDWVKNNDQSLARSPHVQAATQLLDARAPWTAYVSPQGVLQWYGRFFALIAGTLGGPAITIPEYPAGPPLGFSVNVADGQFRGEMVVPVQALKDLAGYIEKQQ